MDESYISTLTCKSYPDFLTRTLTLNLTVVGVAKSSACVLLAARIVAAMSSRCHGTLTLAHSVLCQEDAAPTTRMSHKAENKPLDVAPKRAISSAQAYSADKVPVDDASLGRVHAILSSFLTPPAADSAAVLAAADGATRLVGAAMKWCRQCALTPSSVRARCERTNSRKRYVVMSARSLFIVGMSLARTLQCLIRLRHDADLACEV